MKSEEIKTEYMDILILILRGINTSSKISKKLQIKRTTAGYRLGVLFRKGYIDKNIIHNTRPYELTSKGKDATAKWLCSLRGRPKTYNTKLTAHKVTWVLDITKSPDDLKDLLIKKSFVVSKHKNWYKYTKKIDDFVIVFNPNIVYVYLNAFYFDTPLEYYDMAIAKVRRISKMLQRRFPGLVLGTPDKEMVAQSQHIVKKYGPLAMKFFEESIKAGKPIVYHGNKLNVDFSNGPPEEETVDNRTAPADMLALGDFYNSWLENPIGVHDLHAAADGCKVLQVEQNATIENIKELTVSQDLSDSAIKKVESDQAEMYNYTAKELKEIKDFLKVTGLTQSDLNQAMNGNLMKLVQSHDIFATAMHEHVALIRTLQILAQKNKDGLENGMQQMGTMVQSGFEQMSKLFLGAMGQQNKQHFDYMNVLSEEIKELRTPWYKKLWRKIRK